jgi:hypothetical protein
LQLPAITASLVSDGNIGGACADNFKVIVDNSIVVIKDAASVPVGTVTVSPGRTSAIDYDDVLGTYATKCQFLFTMSAVPDDSSTYFLTVDGHDAGDFTRTELESPVSLVVSDVFTPHSPRGSPFLRTKSDETSRPGGSMNRPLAALASLGIRNPRDNSANCASLGCTELTTTDDISVYVWDDPAAQAHFAKVFGAGAHSSRNVVLSYAAARTPEKMQARYEKALSSLR